MNLPTMDSEGSIDSSLQIGMRVMEEVQEVERTIGNLSSHGPTKPISMRSIRTIKTYPLPIRQMKFGNIMYNTRKRLLRTSRIRSQSPHFPCPYGNPSSITDMSISTSSIQSKEDELLMRRSSMRPEGSSSSSIKSRQKGPFMIREGGSRPSIAMPMLSYSSTHIGKQSCKPINVISKSSSQTMLPLDTKQSSNLIKSSERSLQRTHDLPSMTLSPTNCSFSGLSIQPIVHGSQEERKAIQRSAGDSIQGPRTPIVDSGMSVTDVLGTIKEPHV